jgi:CubicO group peptidase (beta-lactamase class C family)
MHKSKFLSFGLGFGLNSPQMPLGPNPNTFFWGGWGGSVISIDQDAEVAIAYVMNKMHSGLIGDTRSAPLIQAVFESLSA